MKKAEPLARRSRSVVAAMMMGAAIASLSGEPARAAQPSTQSVTEISRYCQVCWRNARLQPDQWPDCTQEVLTRLLERVEPSRWSGLLKQESEDRREFLRAIDAVKKRTLRARKWNGMVEDLADHRDQVEDRRNELREIIDRASLETLTQRQQRILRMSGEGWSIPEIANELATTVERVSDEKYKAIRKLRKHLHIA